MLLSLDFCLAQNHGNPLIFALKTLALVVVVLSRARFLVIMFSFCSHLTYFSSMLLCFHFSIGIYQCSSTSLYIIPVLGGGSFHLFHTVELCGYIYFKCIWAFFLSRHLVTSF
ncbi:hypothetical protein Cni_G06593 [Canna indica]|uniref:Uncharacterized protein n=1 Tax=Canna indica TaxID=4628 RepID=A0AAQ3Q640_9LILI|nr:hypothetical protein Cni_G06593 [Canna indica]